MIDLYTIGLRASICDSLRLLKVRLSLRRICNVCMIKMREDLALCFFIGFLPILIEGWIQNFHIILEDMKNDFQFSPFFIAAIPKRI